MSEEINEVYDKVNELFKIKIRAQIKGTGLIFEQILSVRDLLDGSESYNIVINNKVFGFNTVKEFYTGLLRLVKEVSKENKLEIDYYEEHKTSDLRPDASFFNSTLEELYEKDYKYNKLEAQLLKLIA